MSTKWVFSSVSEKIRDSRRKVKSNNESFPQVVRFTTLSQYVRSSFPSLALFGSVRASVRRRRRRRVAAAWEREWLRIRIWKTVKEQGQGEKKGKRERERERNRESEKRKWSALCTKESEREEESVCVFEREKVT